MIVTIVTDVLGEENNGTTIACMNLVRYLKSQGHEVRIVCPDQDKKGMEGYYIVPTLYLGKIIDNYLQKNCVILAKPDTKIIEKALDGADICHCILPFALCRSALKICKKKKIPVTSGFHAQSENLTSHIFLLHSKLANHITNLNFYNHFYKHLDAIHYPTKFIKDLFEKDVRHKTNGYVISNGFNDTYKKTPVQKSEKVRILFTGRYSKEKNHSVLIKAISKSKHKDEIQLVLAGKGPLKDRLTKLAKSLGVNDVVMNFYTREELNTIINSSDLYVHPSEAEIEAISCLEAISCGVVPVIADSNRSATKEFAIDERSLFKCGDSDDLAKKIDYWLDNPKEREIMSEEYLKNTKTYKLSDCMKQMEDMFNTVIRHHGN